MPDLSLSAVKRYRQSKSPSLRRALDEQEAAETFTVDGDREVGTAVIGLGKALDREEILARIMERPKAMDDLRLSLVYMRAARRLRVIEHLADTMHQEVNGAIALVDADGPIQPVSAEGENARRLLNQGVRFLQARKLIAEVFSPKVLAHLQRALDRQAADQGGSHDTKA